MRQPSLYPSRSDLQTQKRATEPFNLAACSRKSPGRGESPPALTGTYAALSDPSVLMERALQILDEESSAWKAERATDEMR